MQKPSIIPLSKIVRYFSLFYTFKVVSRYSYIKVDVIGTKTDYLMTGKSRQ